LIVLRTASAEETKAVATRLARLARARDLVVLAGGLGAGKTVFAQGFAAGLGVLEPVTSPTFTLVHSYDGRLVMYHVDVYRLDRLAELADLALSEVLDGDGVTVIEWGDAIAAALPNDYLEVRLQLPEQEPFDERTIEIRAIGPTWLLRYGEVETAVKAWRC
jgi:tRNA threonylcarbamoyladenosine biosynthesis protein TsaE